MATTIFFVTILIKNLYVFVWDFILEIINVLTPNRKKGHVTPHGTPGARGKWPQYVAPMEGDSRSSCPALNAMANHGILPHDGKNIRFDELPGKIDAAFNFAPTISFFVTNLAAKLLKKEYKGDTFDLAELDLHNGIEHDASLTREDTGLVPDQSKPHLPFVRDLLMSASKRDKGGSALLTRKDISRFFTKRRVDSRVTNPDFSLDLFHKLIGDLNTSFLLTIFAGRVDDLKCILIEERIPEGWESHIRARKGLTFTASLPAILGIEGGIQEKKYEAKIAAEAAAMAALSNKDGYYSLGR